LSYQNLRHRFCYAEAILGRTLERPTSFDNAGCVSAGPSTHIDAEDKTNVTVALFLLAFSLATAQDAEQQGVRLLVSITFEDHEEADGSAARDGP
jgi:hypothetical protein